MSSAKSGNSEEEQEKIQRGFIFHGPGGTGKNSIVEAIGDQLISLTTFIKVSGADLLEKSNINELFNKANENAPCRHYKYNGTLDTQGLSHFLASRLKMGSLL